MNDQLVSVLVAVGVMLLVGFPIHEFSHAFAAFRLGDSTARWQGRLTLDPRVHFDPVGGLLLVVSALYSGGGYFLGYAKPTPVNPMNLRRGRHGEALVAAAGPLSNLVMAAIVAIPLRILIASPDLLRQVLASRGLDFLLQVGLSLLTINVFLFVFNLIPVPPLDGWRVLMGLVPAPTAWQLRRFEQQYGQYLPILLLFIVILMGARIIGPIAGTIINLLVGAQLY